MDAGPFLYLASQTQITMDDCIFCKIVAGEAPSWKVYETDRVYAFLDINPVNPYHTLVIPKKHYQDIFDTPADELKEIIFVIKHLTTTYKYELNLQHIQIVNSSGREAQQDVFHIHFHIVPRELGDGQNIRWKTKPELRGDFEAYLAALNL